jgi:hypothetical protein
MCPWNQPVIVFTFTLNFTGTIGAGVTVDFNIHRGIAGATPAETPVLTIQLTAGEKIKSITTQSAVFKTGDTMAWHALLSQMETQVQAHL